MGNRRIGIDESIQLPICNRPIVDSDCRFQTSDYRLIALFRPNVPYCTDGPRDCGMVVTSRRAEYSVLLERVYAMPSSAARKGKSMTVLTIRTRR
jgi:hypothetical protein